MSDPEYLKGVPLRLAKPFYPIARPQFKEIDIHIPIDALQEDYDFELERSTLDSYQNYQVEKKRLLLESEERLMRLKEEERIRREEERIRREEERLRLEELGMTNNVLNSRISTPSVVAVNPNPPLPQPIPIPASNVNSFTKLHFPFLTSYTQTNRERERAAERSYQQQFNSNPIPGIRPFPHQEFPSPWAPATAAVTAVPSNMNQNHQPLPPPPNNLSTSPNYQFGGSAGWPVSPTHQFPANK